MARPLAILAGKSSTSLVVLLFTVLAVGAAIWFAQGARGSGPAVRDPAAVLAVETVTLDLAKSYAVAESYAGRLVSRRQSALGFERGGLLAQVLVDEGQMVAAGAALARLDSRALEAQANALAARLAAMRAGVSEAEARLALARTTEERQRQLVAAGHVSQQRYDEARFNREAVAAQLASAAAQATQAKADLRQVEVAIALSQIRAPYAGAITARHADEGTVLAPGQPVLELMEAGALEVRVGLPEAAAQLGDAASYQVEIAGRLYPAYFERLVGAIDPATRTQMAVFRVGGEVVAPPGAMARLHLSRALDDEGFWLPSEALVESQRGLWAAYALAALEGGLYRLERRPVELLHAETDRVFVRGALQDGEQVVAGGLHRLVPGQVVAVRS
ncbi:MAG: efflux RND transporter periplasmic adaptor subunit [Pseudomonadota bacterium]